MVRDDPNMTSREIYDALVETCLASTMRSKSAIEKELGMHRMGDGESLITHFGRMYRIFRELQMAGVQLDNDTKVVKSMCKMNHHWYKIAKPFIAANKDINFAKFRARIMQMELDAKAFQSDRSNNNREATFFHSQRGRNQRSPGRNVRTQNNGIQKQLTASSKIVCDNCGGRNHSVAQCLSPKETMAMEKMCQIFRINTSSKEDVIIVISGGTRLGTAQGKETQLFGRRNLLRHRLLILLTKGCLH